MNFFSILLASFLLTFPPNFYSSFSKGYYYDIQGNRVDGLIKVKLSDYSSFKKKTTRILFKSDEKEVPRHLTIEDMAGFVVDQDSFAMVKNFKINHINGEFEQDFAKVVETGRMNLYQHQSLIGDSFMYTNFVYEKDHFILSKDNKTFVGIWNAQKQREEISLLFADEPELMYRILDKEFDNKIPELVALYNQ